MFVEWAMILFNNIVTVNIIITCITDTISWKETRGQLDAT